MQVVSLLNMIVMFRIRLQGLPQRAVCEMAKQPGVIYQVLARVQNEEHGQKWNLLSVTYQMWGSD